MAGDRAFQFQGLEVYDTESGALLDDARVRLVGEAAEGDVQAMCILGWNAESTLEADSYYRKAAARGSTAAFSLLGHLWFKSGNFARASTWWRKAAQAGCTLSTVLLAEAFHENNQFEEALQDFMLT